MIRTSIPAITPVLQHECEGERHCFVLR